jgi:hypothetical protein
VAKQPIIPVESILWQIANTPTTPVLVPARVASPGGVSGSPPFPQATEEERETDAGDPIGSKNALAQTNAMAKDPADAAAAEKAAKPVVTCYT